MKSGMRQEKMTLILPQHGKRDCTQAFVACLNGPEADELAEGSTARLMGWGEVQKNDGNQEVQWSPRFV
jgi:hypothetical protein